MIVFLADRRGPISIDASEVGFDDYVGRLTATTDNQTFPPVDVMLKRQAWSQDATMAPLSPAVGELDDCWSFERRPGPATLVLGVTRRPRCAEIGPGGVCQGTP